MITQTASEAVNWLPPKPRASLWPRSTPRGRDEVPDPRTGDALPAGEETNFQSRFLPAGPFPLSGHGRPFEGEGGGLSNGYQWHGGRYLRLELNLDFLFRWWHLLFCVCYIEKFSVLIDTIIISSFKRRTPV